ncbi:hypothetical protein AAZX31_04G127100 [Glycine max]|uniref:Transmembrane protein n=2 Tax=Glycine subgen. Soja TaxID=1462606 RepID=I1JWJ6_SOYBN|nr:hypothetical protein GYH30_009858 [Glycine max]KHN10369.1 hypothetical protein glysoja_045477 [Glycine soja]KRH62851.1 hypothetical protein GLYMA_04G137100v4 [Glycine max]RZC16449.1 hypothetical protein D0Y65_009638 [Glycine soja]
MAYLKVVINIFVLLFVLLLSMILATARVPLWISEPHHKAHGRLLAMDDPRDHHYKFTP